MSISYLENDFQWQAYFTEMFSGYSSTGLKDAIIIQHNSILSDWHSEGTDRVNYIFSCTKSFLSALVGIAIDWIVCGYLAQLVFCIKIQPGEHSL